MEKLFQEISEIPAAAEECYKKNQDIQLPLKVPYLGMGASYFSGLTMMYNSKNIKTYMASEYYYYLSSQKNPLGVFISQSGETSELLWCLEKFSEVIVITNNPNSTLALSPKAKQVITVEAGEEECCATKTYINALIVLMLGLGIDPKRAIHHIQEKFSSINALAKKKARLIFRYIHKRKINGLYVLGTGPNIGTAHEAALAMSETTKLAWIGMTLAQFDHGPKETANNTVIISLDANGKERRRRDYLKKTLEEKSNALIIGVEEYFLPENISPISLILQAYLIVNHLADFMGIEKTYKLGSKITYTPKRFQ